MKITRLWIHSNFRPGSTPASSLFLNPPLLWPWLRLQVSRYFHTNRGIKKVRKRLIHLSISLSADFKCTYHISYLSSMKLHAVIKWWIFANLSLCQRQDHKIEVEGLEPEPVIKNPTLAPAPAKMAKLQLHHSGSATLNWKMYFSS